MVERAVIAEAVVVVVWVQCSGGRSWGWVVLEVLKVQDFGDGTTDRIVMNEKRVVGANLEWAIYCLFHVTILKL